MDLPVLQALMGHDHVDSSAAYIHLAPAHVRAAYDAARDRQRAWQAGPLMPPVKTAVPPQAAPIYDAYLGWLAARGVGNKTFDSGARCFLARFPDPQAWAGLPLAARLAGTRPQLQPLLNFLMLHGHLRPGYDYLLDRKLTVILREAAASPLGPDLKRFLAGAEALGYSVRARTGMASEVAIRMLIQTGRAARGAD